MTEMTSAGVYITEIDQSTIATNSSQTTTVFCGKFSKGALEEKIQITTVDELIDFLGKPKNDNYNDWYQCYNFLQYSSNLLVARACNINGTATDLQSTFKEISTLSGYGIQEWGTSTYGIGSNAKWVIVSSNTNIKENDIITFAQDSIEAIEDGQPRFLVLEVSQGVDANNDTVYAIMLDREPYIKDLDGDGEYDQVPLDYEIFRVDISFNGSNECVTNEYTDKIDYTWKKSSRSSFEAHIEVPKFLDSTPYFNPNRENQKLTVEDYDDGTFTDIDNYVFTTNKPSKSDSALLFYYNRQIKNASHFELIKDSLGFYGGNNSKLKFFSRTVGTEDAKYKICIALPSDFAVNDTRFVGNHVSRYVCDGIALDGLFEYAPKLNSSQIAVVIYDQDEMTVKESYLCSLDPSEKDIYNNSIYIEEVINRNSNLVYVKDNVEVPSTITYTKADKKPLYDVYGNVIPNRYFEGVVPNVASYTYTYDSVYRHYIGRSLSLLNASDSDIQADDLMDAYELFNNKEVLDVDIIIANELDNGLSALNLAESRGDCIAYMGIPYMYNANKLTVGQKPSQSTTNIVRFRNAINYNSKFMSLIGNYKYQYDRYNDCYRWLNLAGDCAGLRAKTSTEFEGWYASAGLERGQIKNVVKLAYAPNQTQRGTLYVNNVNPVCTFPGDGTVLWGQKTLYSQHSSFDRVNVRVLFNILERTLGQMSRFAVFEQNDEFTRNKLVATIKPYLNEVQSGRGISGYLVVCDSSNNTPQIIAENKLVCDIYIKPTYVAEFIHLIFTNVGTNDFNIVVSQ